jgi:hypothetical protein
VSVGLSASSVARNRLHHKMSGSGPVALVTAQTCASAAVILWLEWLICIYLWNLKMTFLSWIRVQLLVVQELKASLATWCQGQGNRHDPTSELLAWEPLWNPALWPAFPGPCPGHPFIAHRVERGRHCEDGDLAFASALSSPIESLMLASLCSFSVKWCDSWIIH